MRRIRISQSLSNLARQPGELARIVPPQLVHPIPLLTGLAMGWQWLGLSVILASAINPSPATSMRLGTVALLAAALGPWLPERIVLVLLRFIERNRYGKDDSDADAAANFWMLRAIRQRDQSLLWLSLSVLACIAGVLALFALLFSGVIFHIYHVMLERFFWNHVTLCALEWCIIGAWVSIPWLINGLVIATLAPVLGTPTHSQRDLGGVSSGVTVGLGISWILHRIWADAGLSGQQIYLFGVLAIFIVAALSAWLSQHASRAVGSPADLETDAPEIAGGGEGLIWLSLVAWGIASVLVMMGWLASQASTGFGAGSLMLLLGLGVFLASFHARHKTSSASGCGMAVWAAGVCAAIVATLVAFQSSTVGLRWLQIILLSFPVGYALHYAERAWLARVGSETVGFTQLITAIFGGLAIGLVMGYWWMLPRLSPIGTVSAGSLLMLALGGFVQIHERYRPVHTQHLRLAIIFASLAVATVLFPADVRRWTIHERAAQVAEHSAAEPDPALLKQMSTCRRVCIIQSDAAPLPVAFSRAHDVDIVPLAPPALESPSWIDPLSWLRLEHHDYDFIYQRSRALPEIERYGEYSVEWLTQFRKHIAPDGQICIDVPLMGMSEEAIVTIAATFAKVIGPTAGWTLANVDGQSFFRLHGGELKAGEPSGGYAEMACLFIGEIPRAIHSLARDRLTKTVQTRSESLNHIVSWLDHCRARGLASVEQ